MRATVPVRLLTKAENLDFERKADVKHKFFDGGLFASVEFQSESVRPAGL